MKTYDYKAMHQACINWCEDENRVWPEFLEGCEVVVNKDDVYIFDNDRDGLIGLYTEFDENAKGTILLFAKFIELNLSKFEVKPMTKYQSVREYWESLKIGDPIHEGSKFFKISDDRYAYQSDPNHAALFATHYDHESYHAFAYEIFRLDQHPKYKDAV